MTPISFAQFSRIVGEWVQTEHTKKWDELWEELAKEKGMTLKEYFGEIRSHYIRKRDSLKSED
jgi:hypothetical protein